MACWEGVISPCGACDITNLFDTAEYGDGRVLTSDSVIVNNFQLVTGKKEIVVINYEYSHQSSYQSSIVS